MAISALTYTSTFPPPVTKRLHLAALISSSSSVYTPPNNFPLFSMLPYELQHQIWTEAAKQWIKEYLERVNTWTVTANDSSNDNNHTFSSDNNINVHNSINSNSSSSGSKIIFLIHITSNPAYRRHSPNLLWACSASRDVLYDTLLNAKHVHRADRRVQRGADIQLFLRRCVTPMMGVGNPGIFGCRVQDFGYPDLPSRVGEEAGRLVQMKMELEQVTDGTIVDPHVAGQGYVRLPLLNGLGRVFRKDFESGRWVVRELYPVVDMDAR